MSLKLTMPPMASGSEAQQLSAVREYLFIMARQLNAALSSLESGTLTVNGAAGGAQSGSLTGAETQLSTAEEMGALRSRMASAVSEAEQEFATLRSSMASAVSEAEQEFETLRSSIISAAETVEREIETVEAQLRSELVAQSDYGTFTETVTTMLAAGAEYFNVAYEYYSALSASVAANGASFDDYVSRTSGYIRAGIVDWENSKPVFGVAVGQGITATTVTVDGTVYDQIDRGRFVSVFTAKKLSFCQNDVEVAYLSNERLHITAAHISDRLELGSGWHITPLRGLTIKWVGERMLGFSLAPGNPGHDGSPEEMAEEQPEELPEEEPEEVFEEAPEEAPEEVAEEQPEELPEEEPGEVFEEQPEEAPEETPEGVLGETPEEVPEELPEEVSEEAPEEELEELPEELPEEVPEETPEEIPEEAPEEGEENV